MRKLLVVLALPLFTACVHVSEPTEGPAPTGPVEIGGIVPLSGDGAAYGIMTQRVTNLRIEEINEAGGINGRQLEILWEDGKCNPADASRAAQKLIGIDKVSVILGGACSGETLGAAPIAEKKKVILFSPLSSSPEITNAGDFVFRTAPSDSSQGKVLAQYANKNFQKMGMVTEQTDYAIGVANVFKEHFTGEIVSENYLSTESDYRTRITKLKNESPDALLLIPQTPQKFEILLKQLQEQNWRTPLLINEVAAGNMESVQKFTQFLTTNKTVSANFVAPENKKLQKFIEKYETKFSEKPAYINYAATTIDAIDILAKVLRKVGDETQTEKIRDALYATKNYNGIFEKLSFDENGDVNITHSLFEFDGEQFVPLGK